MGKPKILHRVNEQKQHKIQKSCQMLCSMLNRSHSQVKIIAKANNFRSGNCIYCCTQQLLLTAPETRSKTQGLHNTGSRVMNTLLPGTATFDAVKYPVGLHSSAREIWWGGWGSRHLNRSWNALMTTRCYTATDSILKKSKTNLDEAVILSFTQQCRVQCQHQTAPEVLELQLLQLQNSLTAFELESPVPKAAGINWESLENCHKKASGSGQK